MNTMWMFSRWMLAPLLAVGVATAHAGGPAHAPAPPSRKAAADAAHGAVGRRVGPVRPGQTLMSIARQTRPPGIGISQMVMAFYRLNPDAFYATNVNALLWGSTLTVPDAAQARRTSQAAALAEVHRQNLAWHGPASPARAAARGTPAPAVSASAAAADTAPAPAQTASATPAAAASAAQPSSVAAASTAMPAAAAAPAPAVSAARAPSAVETPAAPLARPWYPYGVGLAVVVLLIVALVVVVRRRRRAAAAAHAAGEAAASVPLADDAVSSDAAAATEAAHGGVPASVASATPDIQPEPEPEPIRSGTDSDSDGTTAAATGSETAASTTGDAAAGPHDHGAVSPVLAEVSSADQVSGPVPPMPARDASDVDAADTRMDPPQIHPAVDGPQPEVAGDAAWPALDLAPIPDVPDPAAAPDAEAPFTDDPVDIKLDLARAYIDMGDVDGARAMLTEVLDEGRQMQRDIAQQLLDGLD